MPRPLLRRHSDSFLSQRTHSPDSYRDSDSSRSTSPKSFSRKHHDGHRSQHENRGRPVTGGPRRPSLDRDDSSYYDPRDKYYLSGDDDHESKQPPQSPRESRESRESGSTRRHSGQQPRTRSTDRHSRRGSHDHEAYDDHDQDRGGHRSRSHHRRRPSPDQHSPRSRSIAGAAATGGVGAAVAAAGAKLRERKRDKGYYPPSASRSKSLFHDGPRRRGSTSSVDSGSTHGHGRGRDRDRDRDRSRSSSSEGADNNNNNRRRSSSREVLMKAARTAFEAGAVAALKLRNDPSPWIGPKGAKIATAAIGAAVVDTFMEQKHPKRKGGMRHTMMRQATQMAIGSLVMKPVMKKAPYAGKF